MLFSLTATKEGLLISLENDEGTERGEQNSSSGQLTQHLQNFFFLFFLSGKQNVGGEPFGHIFRGECLHFDKTNKERFVANRVVRWCRSLKG